jgi:hypothetical protein
MPGRDIIINGANQVSHLSSLETPTKQQNKLAAIKFLENRLERVEF